MELSHLVIAYIAVSLFSLMVMASAGVALSLQFRGLYEKFEVIHNLLLKDVYLVASTDIEALKEMLNKEPVDIHFDDTDQEHEFKNVTNQFLKARSTFKK